MIWNYLSIPKLQRWSHRSLGMDRLFHPTLHWACDYSSMCGFKLIHVIKWGPTCNCWELVIERYLLLMTEWMWKMSLALVFHGTVFVTGKRTWVNFNTFTREPKTLFITVDFAQILKIWNDSIACISAFLYVACIRAFLTWSTYQSISNILHVSK